ncbi:4-hydroxythreonine-4-phosphate dehydrogenase PdxA [Solitalea sp. MAHUQ-68]|uniref:4-hydroxythreonine-4-phosphate dehydrogenase PdxA n=1 Tax=Solitalea agri TaxID=2953739 RepID=A0A9X2JEI4_9SPHI|nr:4-hydroxythreonine-4-phosphate dehydrogenase PdxA [Solitalea agri]MCO4294759.1 4-hydroxythreonine-4-phosphate dehydrogenase PdxA [Solitalea agri]
MSNVPQKKIKVGISIGDINGIGIEVILKALLDNRILELCTPIVYGSVKITSFHRKALNIQDFSFNIIQNSDQANPKRANLINCWEEEVKIDMGQQTENGGKYAFKSLEAATADLLAGKIDALVTAPINKHNIQQPGFDFPGHTEYLQEKAGSGESLMFLVSEDLRVGVVTGHIPIKEVADSISVEKILAKLRLMNISLKKDFWVEKPKIAVLGLNPHASDNGLIGDEETNIIMPAIEEARKEKIFAFGPYPADGFFGKGLQNQFDAVLAMYHDQGLVAFKALSFGTGVNFTAGLPVVRTSPDHGTGYDIAGKNQANEASFRRAIYMAVDVVRKRWETAELLENPLKVGQLKMKVTHEDSEE